MKGQIKENYKYIVSLPVEQKATSSPPLSVHLLREQVHVHSKGKEKPGMPSHIFPSTTKNLVPLYMITG